jgi:broad-specificity NMP kinase
MSTGGVLLEHHSVDYFPERWFELVLVLTCDNSALYDRLRARGYSQVKVSENIEAEIMRVIAEEAHEAYPSGMVHELPSGTVADMESNCARVEGWLAQWVGDHPTGVEARPQPGGSGESAGALK